MLLRYTYKINLERKLSSLPIELSVFPTQIFYQYLQTYIIMSPVSEGLELRYLVLLVFVVLASCILATVIGGLVVWAR